MVVFLYIHDQPYGYASTMRMPDIPDVNLFRPHKKNSPVFFLHKELRDKLTTKTRERRQFILRHQLIKKKLK